jgi:hypothetical protein
MVTHFCPIWTQKYIGVVILFNDLSILEGFSLLQQTIHHGKWGIQVLLIQSGDYVHHRKRVVQRFCQHMCEKIDCVGQDMRIFTDKDHPVFQHDESKQIEKRFKRKHAQDRIDPLPDEESPSLLVVGQQGNLGLVQQPQFVLFVKRQFFILEILEAII